MTNPSDDEYRRRSAENLSGVEYGPKPLVTVTDAEILALDGPEMRRVTPLLGLGPTVSDQQRNLMVEEAANRLFSTGRADDGSPLGGDDLDTPEPTVRTVLRMRRSWLALLLVDQQMAIGRQWLTVYLRADRRAIAESVTPDGRHTFTALKRAAALDSVAQDLTPFPDAADEDGPHRTYSMSTWQQEAAGTLAASKVVTTVIVKRHDGTMRHMDDQRFAVYNLADRTELFVGEPDGRVNIGPIARRTLRDRLDRVTRPLDPVDGEYG